jgi:hypothetical protein
MVKPDEKLLKPENLQGAMAKGQCVSHGGQW